MNRFTRRHAIRWATLISAPFGMAANAQTQWAPVPGIYSNMEYDQRVGDTVGLEIFIIPAGDAGHFALVQCSETALNKPVLVQARFKGSSVTLDAHTDSVSACPRRSFVGTITNTDLSGRFYGSDRLWRLTRKSSVWQRERTIGSQK